MSISIITRADDLGSCLGAVLAAQDFTSKGSYIKNISCLAPGPFIEKAADLLKDRKDICFGLHACITAEWDYLKWLPVSPIERIPTLISETGSFPAAISWYEEHVPDVDEILLEYNAQLDLLTKLGFKISYVDSHMMPETVIPGLNEAFKEWAYKKGLVFHLPFYRQPGKFEPDRAETVQNGVKNWISWLKLLQEGQYFSIMHPAKKSRETLLLANSDIPSGAIALARDIEYRVLMSGKLEEFCNMNGITRIRYDEAVPQP